MSSPIVCETCGRTSWLKRSQVDYVCQSCRLMEIVVPVGPWVIDARCAEVGGDLWYATNTKGGPTRENLMAKRICDDCPVKQQCLDWALENNERYGIWGGATPRERRGMRKPSTHTEGPEAA